MKIIKYKFHQPPYTRKESHGKKVKQIKRHSMDLNIQEPPHDLPLLLTIHENTTKGQQPYERFRYRQSQEGMIYLEYANPLMQIRALTTRKLSLFESK